MEGAHQTASKQVRLFRNNRSQAVHIPAEFELPGDRVTISRERDRLIIEPVRSSTGLIYLLAGWEPLDETFPEIEDTLLNPEDIF